MLRHPHPGFSLIQGLHFWMVRSSARFAVLPADSLVDLVGNITSAMPSDWDYGAYLNYLDTRLQNCKSFFPSLNCIQRHRTGKILYYNDSYSRLTSIKAQVDPTNLFKFALSVEEGTAGSNVSDSSGGSSSKYSSNAPHTTFILTSTLSLSLLLAVLLEIGS